jgi:hypothetical protein
MGNDTTAVLLQRLIEIEACKDSIEFGKADGRIKVYMNSNDPQGCVDKIQAMIDARGYAETALPEIVHRKQQGADPPPDVVSGTAEKGRGA